MQLTIEQHDDDTTTINGTRYTNVFFENFGCSFPNMVGQTLRIDKKEDGLVTVTIITVPADDAAIKQTAKESGAEVTDYFNYAASTDMIVFPDIDCLKQFIRKLF